jgi:hypothetical protein
MLCVCLAATLLAVAVHGILMSTGRQATIITRKNAMRINNLMTAAQVEGILGGPARIESTEQFRPDVLSPENDAFARRLAARAFEAGRDIDDRPSILTWQSNEVRVDVAFDREGRVADAVVIPMECVQTDQNIVDIVLRWFGLR